MFWALLVVRHALVKRCRYKINIHNKQIIIIAGLRCSSMLRILTRQISPKYVLECKDSEDPQIYTNSSIIKYVPILEYSIELLLIHPAWALIVSLWGDTKLLLPIISFALFFFRVHFVTFMRFLWLVHNFLFFHFFFWLAHQALSSKLPHPQLPTSRQGLGVPIASQPAVTGDAQILFTQDFSRVWFNTNYGLPCSLHCWDSVW